MSRPYYSKYTYQPKFTARQPIAGTSSAYGKPMTSHYPLTHRKEEKKEKPVSSTKAKDLFKKSATKIQAVKNFQPSLHKPEKPAPENNQRQSLTGIKRTNTIGLGDAFRKPKVKNPESNFKITAKDDSKLKDQRTKANPSSARASNPNRFGLTKSNTITVPELQRKKNAMPQDNLQLKKHARDELKTNTDVKKKPESSVHGKTKEPIRPATARTQPKNLNKEEKKAPETVKKSNKDASTDDDEPISNEKLEVYEELLKLGYSLPQVRNGMKHCGFSFESVKRCLEEHNVL